MQATTLLIARHGDTFKPSETEKFIGVKTDLPLVTSGKAQGKALGQYLKKHKLVPQVIFTSTLQRSMQMAEQVKKGLGLADITIEALEIFNEIDYGPDENKSEEEVIARIGADGLKAWEEHALPPLGWTANAADMRASWYDFADRVAHEYNGQTILVITHNGVARFSSVLTGDSHGLECDDSSKANLKLNTGAFGHLIHTDMFWKCLEWNVQP